MRLGLRSKPLVSHLHLLILTPWRMTGHWRVDVQLQHQGGGLPAGQVSTTTRHQRDGQLSRVPSVWAENDPDGPRRFHHPHRIHVRLDCQLSTGAVCLQRLQGSRHPARALSGRRVGPSSDPSQLYLPRLYGHGAESSAGLGGSEEDMDIVDSTASAGRSDGAERRGRLVGFGRLILYYGCQLRHWCMSL